ncbi:metal-dependent hydrolase [Candidatus Woesearchaeota archaeon]|nr:metal-dependent hydrolase [Candidatus Woesearchaeota archaeon]
MKFTGHYIINIFIVIMVSFVFGYRIGLMIGLAHFIPSIDWVLKRIDVFYHHHRSLLHNIFIIPLSYILFFLLTKNQILSIFCALSTTLHILIDYLDVVGRGIALFFPFSQKRYKLPLISETAEDILVNGAMLATIIMCMILVVK